MAQQSGIMRNSDRLPDRPAPIELEYGFDCVSLCKNELSLTSWGYLLEQRLQIF